MRTAKQVASLMVLAVSGAWLLIGTLIFLGTAWAQLTPERAPQQSGDLLFQLSEQVCTADVVDSGDFTEGPDFRFTWYWASDGDEREAAYRLDTCQQMVQMGRPLVSWEASEVAKYFVDPSAELAGHLCLGTPLWLMSLVAVKALYSVHRERRKTVTL